MKTADCADGRCARSGRRACTLASMTHAPEIRFLPFAGRRVAYAVTGDGPPLVASAWWVSHLELDWGDPAFRGLWESACAGYTVVRYDRLGVGMSDRDLRDEDLTLDAEVALLGAVLDQLALQKVVLVGGSLGGCAAIAFAARFPERVDRLLLYGAYADGSSITSPEVREAIIATVRSHWGLGSRVLADLFLGDADRTEQQRLARHQRAAATPETATALLELLYRHDVRAELEQVRAPTLVVHRRGDRAIPYHLGRELAAAIPGATLIPLAGSAHVPWAGDVQSVVRALRSVLAPEAPARIAGEPAALLLSGREREVLALVAKGLSDPEIAEQLVLSQHTVHRHVANIRNKLGRSSRTAAVAEAARLGLL
jgi:pimeloyl-ACP methyl ester carboxylesterase/DNA-binding CsgD family transcriptional regulator